MISMALLVGALFEVGNAPPSRANTVSQSRPVTGLDLTYVLRSIFLQIARQKSVIFGLTHRIGMQEYTLEDRPPPVPYLGKAER